MLHDVTPKKKNYQDFYPRKEAKQTTTTMII